jgi:hypothetical protein
MSDSDLTTDEGINERGSDAEAEGPTPAVPPDGATAPGLAVGEGHGALDEAPEPNEPA